MSKFQFGKMNDRHEEFLDLCAAATSCELTDSERGRLEVHLSQCGECREAMRQFNSIAYDTMPAIAAEYAETPTSSTEQPWDEDEALSSLMQLIPHEDKPNEEWQQHPASIPSFAFRGSNAWRNIFVAYAAGALLFIVFGIALYRVGVERGTRAAASASATERDKDSALDQALDDAKRESCAQQVELQQRNRSIVEHRRDLRRQATELREIKIEREQLEASIRDSEAEKQRLVSQQSDVFNKNEIAESHLAVLGENLHSAEVRESEQSARIASLQLKAAELQKSLDAKSKVIDEEQQLLARDRDIRELMGERDLYVAEVYDVDGHGTRKPYGRVFYTKGKLLVFYAYDLDQQNATHNASFQAWGRVDEDRKKTLSLGIFYEDNAANRRWVLKTSDPRLLSRVDEVFVTVEPNGGSSEPSSRRILFAYLNATPNH